MQYLDTDFINTSISSVIESENVKYFGKTAV